MNEFEEAPQEKPSNPEDISILCEFFELLIQADQKARNESKNI